MLAGELVWPPTKEDLVRLYLVEKKSAMKIAAVYGLEYKSPKVAESTILYHLKRNGINRRDRAEHIRKVTGAMVDVWVARYEGGESLKQIAGESVDPVTVWNHLTGRGLVLRNKVDAQIEAVTKHKRRPFGGDPIERAYLMGLRYGDLNAVRHGRAVRVRVSTTHPAMADLFESLFSPFGFVHRYPREAKLTGYEWTLECDLDSSFQFLLKKTSLEDLKLMSKDEQLAFLAGLFDAEGSVFLHNKRGRSSPEVCYTNSDKELIRFVTRALRNFGYNPVETWLNQVEDRNGITGPSLVGRVAIWRFIEVQRFVLTIPLRHREKTAKSQLVLKMSVWAPRKENLRIKRSWNTLMAELEKERTEFLWQAKSLLMNKEHHLSLVSKKE